MRCYPSPHRGPVRFTTSARPNCLWNISRCLAKEEGYYIEVTNQAAAPRILFASSSEYNHQVKVVEVPDHADVHECISELRGLRILILDAVGEVHEHGGMICRI